MILSERLKQHAIEFLTIENMPPIDIHRRMKVTGPHMSAQTTEAIDGLGYTALQHP